MAKHVAKVVAASDSCHSSYLSLIFHYIILCVGGTCKRCAIIGYVLYTASPHPIFRAVPRVMHGSSWHVPAVHAITPLACQLLPCHDPRNSTDVCWDDAIDSIQPISNTSCKYRAWRVK